MSELHDLTDEVWEQLAQDPVEDDLEELDPMRVLTAEEVEYMHQLRSQIQEEKRIREYSEQVNRPNQRTLKNGPGFQNVAPVTQLPGYRPTGKKWGKPPKRIPWDVVGGMFAIGCTTPEIEAITGVDLGTLSRRCEAENKVPYTQWRDAHKARGKMSIRRKMLSMALDGDSKMLIWLSKNYLGMSDKTESVETKKLVIEFADRPATPELPNSEGGFSSMLGKTDG
jgi:hypothetical protein